MFTKIGPTVKDDKALFYYYYAQAAFGTGQYDRYLELLEEAIRLDPAAYKATRVDAYLSVADQYNEAGNLDKYIEFLGKAVAESPMTASLHLKLGNAYEEARKLDKAIAQWRMVLDIEPDHPAADEALEPDREIFRRGEDDRGARREGETGAAEEGCSQRRAAEGHASDEVRRRNDSMPPASIPQWGPHPLDSPVPPGLDSLS